MKIEKGEICCEYNGRRYTARVNPWCTTEILAREESGRLSLDEMADIVRRAFPDFWDKLPVYEPRNTPITHKWEDAESAW